MSVGTSRLKRSRTGAVAAKNSKGATMPIWVTSGLTRRKCPAARPSARIAPSVPTTRRISATIGGVEVAAAVGDLAQPHRRKLRLGERRAGDGLDEAAQLRLRGASPLADGFDGAGDAAEQVEQDRLVERGLALEVVVEHRLVDAGAGGDAVDLGAVEPAGGELLGGGREDPVAGGGGAGGSPGGRGHGS